jgi:tRNA(Ile)-lysidine synthase
MLHALARLRDKLGFGLIGHGIDHGLRAEAADELAMARSVAASVGVAFEVTALRVAPGSNLMARARSARLEALRAAAIGSGAAHIATGHTADDRAETFLLRMLRGAGPRGLAVLPPRAEMPTRWQRAAAGAPPAGIVGAKQPGLIRPLLRARRGDVLAHLERHHVPYAHDPSNDDSRFSRVRVRRELLPLLEELSPGIVAHLCALADMMLGAKASDPHPQLDELGRAQREAVQRARRLGRSAIRVRVRGGRDVEVTFPGAEVVLNPPECESFSKE